MHVPGGEGFWYSPYGSHVAWGAGSKHRVTCCPPLAAQAVPLDLKSTPAGAEASKQRGTCCPPLAAQAVPLDLRITPAGAEAYPFILTVCSASHITSKRSKNYPNVTTQQKQTLAMPQVVVWTWDA